MSGVDEDPAPWRGRWLLYLGGVAMIWVGVDLVLRDPHGWTAPISVVRWMVGGAISHDLAAAPILIVLGLVLRRVLPASVRTPVQGGLIVTGALILGTLPQLRGYGRRADNATLQPRDYTRGLLLALAVVWGCVLVLIVYRLVRRRGARPHEAVEVPASAAADTTSRRHATEPGGAGESGGGVVGEDP